MTARLAIDDRDDYGRYRIGWYFSEDGDFGAMLGDTKYAERDLAKMTCSEDRDCVIAYLAAVKTEGVEVGRDGIWWDGRKRAQNALRAIKAAVSNAEHPWPEWAVKARAAGWTPPKGWKP